MTDKQKGPHYNESYLDYKKRVIDPVSGSFCAAKWYNATIWLGYGATVSCHHPAAHQIDIEEIKTNPTAIHNTKQKKEARAQMLTGERPSECEYCWKVEDIQKDNISDRVFKTAIYDHAQLQEAATRDPHSDVALDTLEISFDRTCNFACSYCSPAFSTTWVKDISDNGKYENIITDGRHHYGDTAPWAQPYKRTDTNPYVEAFWAWWPELSKNLTELRITGGEPLMSDDVWKLLTKFNTEQLDIRLAINSNLGAKKALIDKLISESHGIKSLDLYTSNEAYGKAAEYIRHGLDYEQWKTNVGRLASEGKFRNVSVMMTINALCLPSITEFLDDILEIKKTYGKNYANFSMNILRFPNFQSPLVLPRHLITLYNSKLKNWLMTNRSGDLLMPFEISHAERLIDYLDNVESPTSVVNDIADLENDFKEFYSQYDKRRCLRFHDAFPEELVAWYDSINTSVSNTTKYRTIPIYAN